MVRRDEIKEFLVGQKDKSREEVIANFGSWLSVQHLNTAQIGKIFSDVLSYPEWTWGE